MKEELFQFLRIENPGEQVPQALSHKKQQATSCRERCAQDES